MRFGLPAFVFQPRTGLLGHQPSDAGPRGFRQGDPARLDQFADLLQPCHAAHADRRLQPCAGRLRQGGALFAQQRAGLLQPRRGLCPAGRTGEGDRRLLLGHQALPRFRQRLYLPRPSARTAARPAGREERPRHGPEEDCGVPLPPERQHLLDLCRHDAAFRPPVVVRQQILGRQLRPHHGPQRRKRCACCRYSSSR